MSSLMVSFLMVSFESPVDSDIALGLLYWQITEDGRWTYSVKEIAERLGISQYNVPTKVSGAAPVFLMDVRCPDCFHPRMARSRTEFETLTKFSVGSCNDCHERARVAALRAEQQKAQVEQELQQAIWLHNSSIDQEADYSCLDYSDAIRAYEISVISEADEFGNLKFADEPPFSADPETLVTVARNLFRDGVLLIGNGTPLNAFVAGDSVTNFSYYPARMVWRFAPVEDPVCSSVPGRELAHYVDNPPSEFEYWNSIAEIWWTESYSEAFRYLNEQLDKYGLQATETDALREAIHHLLRSYSVPQARNLLWKLAKDIAAYSAQRDIVRPRAINAIPGQLTRMVDRYLANRWEVAPYALRWDCEEPLLLTVLFDRVVKTGIEAYKTLCGRTIEEQRTKCLNQPAVAKEK